MIFIIVLLFVIVFGVLGFITYKRIEATKPENMELQEGNKVDVAQDFLPFTNITAVKTKDDSIGIIDLGLHQYRAIIECSSINYGLKTETEKDMIEMTYQRMLNSLSHPISFFILTKEVDNTRMLNILSDNIKNAVDEFPQVEKYAVEYFENIQDLFNQIGNNKEKHKYIIVPYDEAQNLSNLTDEEKFEYAYKELLIRCKNLIESLSGLKIQSKILNEAEVINVIYSNYHKDNLSQADNISSGDFLKMIVDADDKLNNASDELNFDRILYQAQMSLQTEISNSSDDIKLKELSRKIINELNEYRKDVNQKK